MDVVSPVTLFMVFSVVLVISLIVIGTSICYATSSDKTDHSQEDNAQEPYSPYEDSPIKEKFPRRASDLVKPSLEMHDMPSSPQTPRRAHQKESERETQASPENVSFHTPPTSSRVRVNSFAEVIAHSQDITESNDSAVDLNDRSPARDEFFEPWQTSGDSKFSPSRPGWMRQTSNGSEASPSGSPVDEQGRRNKKSVVPSELSMAFWKNKRLLVEEGEMEDDEGRWMSAGEEAVRD